MRVLSQDWTDRDRQTDRDRKTMGNADQTDRQQMDRQAGSVLQLGWLPALPVEGRPASSWSQSACRTGLVEHSL